MGVPDESDMSQPAAQAPESGVDVTLVDWMLSLSYDERLEALQGFVDSVFEIVDEETPAL